MSENPDAAEPNPETAENPENAAEPNPETAENPDAAEPNPETAENPDNAGEPNPDAAENVVSAAPSKSGTAITVSESPSWEKAKEGQDFLKAKSYLLTASTNTGQNLYDHLSLVISKVLDERPDNVVDIFEDVSKDIKKSKLQPDVDTIQDKIDKSTEVALALIQKKLFARAEGDDDEAPAEDEEESPLPNLMELCFYFEQSGIGLNREEMIRLWLALKKLLESNPLETVRFWGKVLGTEQNYYVAEVEYREGEEEEVEEEEEEQPEEEAPEKEGDEDDEDEEAEETVPTPKPDFKPPPEVPKEDSGTGVNKKVFFVCNEPGKVWVKLPQVTPAQISGARKIKKFFTGRLDAPVVTFPPFPGNESNYLRAQIARISAGTQISPLGYYQFDEDEEEDEEEGNGPTNFIVSEEFEAIPVRELIDPSLANWVHHVQHILPQGRTSWWNPSQKNEEEEEDEDEEEEEETEEPEPEEGPPLLNPLSEDEEVNNMPLWTAYLSTNTIPQFAVAVMRSNLWPGAYAFGFDSKFENVYVGTGHKYSQDNYTPPPPPPIQQEYLTGPEITETEDPTPEEEAAAKAAELEAADAEEEEEEGDDAEEEDDEEGD
ncbi:LOW QUALITY PROTEIN: radial spoke head protein 6 homolog A-like [Babylonia areolata]|uniref:LOW QUALITY PROTEIN: radial spoke head protein 6 homolog A-like n=1 Tax=Babylonia areolata TaxID=304850 RepID=UPI003FD4BA26